MQDVNIDFLLKVLGRKEVELQLLRQENINLKSNLEKQIKLNDALKSQSEDTKMSK